MATIITPEGVRCLGRYVPYRLPDGSKNPEFDEYSGYILDVKDGLQRGFDYFRPRVSPYIRRGAIIVTAPSSDSTKSYTGLRRFAMAVAPQVQAIDGTGTLVRHTTILKAAHGGPRNVQAHLDSIGVLDGLRLRGAHILLLDDVMTSGSTLLACRQILQREGPQQIDMVALARTVR